MKKKNTNYVECWRKKKKCTAGILTSHLGVIKKVHKSKSSFPSKGSFDY